MSLSLFFVLLLTVADYLVSLFFFLMIRRPPRSTLDRSSAASDVYKRQLNKVDRELHELMSLRGDIPLRIEDLESEKREHDNLSLIHISEPTRPY